MDAVTEGGVVRKGACELRQFAKILNVETHPVHVSQEKLEEADIVFCYFEVECFLPGSP